MHNKNFTDCFYSLEMWSFIVWEEHTYLSHTFDLITVVLTGRFKSHAGLSYVGYVWQITNVDEQRQIQLLK
jgi:hypothetical protein